MKTSRATRGTEAAGSWRRLREIMRDNIGQRTTITALLALDNRALGEVIARVPLVAAVVRACVEIVLDGIEAEESNE